MKRNKSEMAEEEQLSEAVWGEGSLIWGRRIYVKLCQFESSLLFCFAVFLWRDGVSVLLS